MAPRDPFITRLTVGDSLGWGTERYNPTTKNKSTNNVTAMPFPSALFMV